ncbi:MAG: 3-dehydroquinate synthase [Hymenobacteraceae bacterium]|nr:3-dehydroquinate synthase [Hymenobacteraceae bacterium]
MIDSVFLGPHALPALAAALARPATGRVAVVADTNTARLCLPRLKPHLPSDCTLLTVPAGEAHKTLATCQTVWAGLTAAGVGRDGVLVCLGGGVVTDLGGFCAATYVRGIRCALVPTTLLGMVDAAIGGKNGVDFNHLKNHIGSFREPSEGVFIESAFLDTLDPAELVSGYAEVVKHWLISGDDSAFYTNRYVGVAGADWRAVIREAVATKQRIVAQDPRETGLRRLLNFGHTVGHALESYLLGQGQPVAHGLAVAAGMRAEAWLSRERGLLAETDFDRIDTFLTANFPKAGFSPLVAEEIAALAQYDKKNAGGVVRAVLLTGIGRAEIDQPVTVPEIAAALRRYAVGD